MNTRERFPTLKEAREFVVAELRAKTTRAEISKQLVEDGMETGDAALLVSKERDKLIRACKRGRLKRQSVVLVLTPVLSLIAFGNAHYYRHRESAPPIVRELRELGSTVLFDDGIESDEDIKHLEVYRLVDITPLSAADRLPRLETLHLSCKEQTVDLSLLGEFGKLKSLSISGEKAIDLKPLTRLPKLRSLKLNGREFDDLAQIQELTELTSLELRVTGVSDLSPLASMPNLSWLVLAHSPVFDLAPLTGLSRLRYVDLEGTKVPKKQLEKLLKAVPNCEVVAPDGKSLLSLVREL